MAAVLVAAALVATSCTGGDATGSSPEPPAPELTTAPPSTEPVPMADVLGNSLPVQDFLIHLDMATGSGAELTSFYDDVLTEAGAGAGDTQELVGGFRFAPVESLRASVVDVDGVELPSLSVDYALLDPGPERLDAVSAELDDAVATLEPGAQKQWRAFLDSSADDGGSELLVEIVTADMSERRVHVGPGDLAALDLTFVSSLSPGDAVTSTYLFGQTLPGDPRLEAGLSAHELFAYRWDQGLISMLGGPDGAGAVVDPDVTLVEGSTIRRQEVKGFIALAAYLEGFNEGTQAVDDLLAREATGPVEPDDVVSILPGDIAITASQLRTVVATGTALKRCAEVAAELAERNQPTGDRAVLTTVAEQGLEGLTDDPATTSPDPTASSTPEGTGSEPLSCSPPPDPGELPRLPTGVASGDAHIATIDGASSANQAVGEFLLFDNGTAEIQMRTARWGDGEILQVSFPSAFAARLGDHSVSIHPDGEMWVDGELVELERGEAIVIGDAEVMRWPDGVAVVWSDGTLAEFRLFETRGMVMVTPSSAPAIGLLGNNDADPDNDFFTRSGEQLDRDVETDFERFYGTYVASWRITDDESHFHYGEGESTATFTLAGFPEARASVDDLPDDVRARAETHCRSVGISRDDILEDCVFDVGATGDPTFATEAFIAQRALPEPADAAATDDRPESADGEPVNELTIGDLTIELGPEPSTQMPNGPTTAWTCRSDEGIFSASGRLFESLLVSYEYAIEYIAPDNSRGLPERFILSVERSGESFAWIQTNAEFFADSVREASMDESSLFVEGELHVNDPPVQGRGPGVALPDDARLDAFTINASCAE